MDMSTKQVADLAFARAQKRADLAAARAGAGLGSGIEPMPATASTSSKWYRHPERLTSPSEPPPT
jgi:hypothetical protein